MTQPSEKPKTPSGEPWVWLTALGLALGMFMVLGLCGLIAFKGISVFWPKRLQQITLSAENNPSLFLGEHVLTQYQKNLHEEGAKPVLEQQFFIGNKDFLGQNFRFVENDKILKTELPPNALYIERREYGPAFAFPLELQNSGQSISAQNSNFLPELNRLTQEANRRWKEIEKLEKKQIGQINEQMEKLELSKKKLQNGNFDLSFIQKESEKIDSQKQELQTKYEALAAQAKTLRDAQKKDLLKLQLASGETKEIEIGQILSFYFPNQLGFFQRIGLFFHKIWNFISTEPREANTEGGVFPAIFGTFVMTLLMTMAVIPFGVVGAIYLQEYAKPGLLLRFVRIAINNLAGVPSIVFGVFGLGFFVYFVGGSVDSIFFSNKLPTPTFGTGGLLWSALTMALMTVPVVIVATEEALSSVSRGIREGALACGASKWQVISRILLPACSPGILTGAILAMARGAGEVAPLMLVGVVKMAPTLPINGTFPFIHLDQKFMHLGFHIYDLGFQSPDSEAAKPIVFATTLLLILIVLLLNTAAIFLRERLRRKYVSSSF